MEKIIYHYYFNVYNDKTNRQLYVREEKYVTVSEFTPCFKQPKNKVIVFCKFDKKRLDLDKDLNKVLSGRSIFMLERNDELALDLFTNYLDNKINSLHEELNDVNNLLDFIRIAKFDSEESTWRKDGKTLKLEIY